MSFKMKKNFITKSLDNYFFPRKLLIEIASHLFQYLLKERRSNKMHYNYYYNLTILFQTVNFIVYYDYIF